MHRRQHHPGLRRGEGKSYPAQLQELLGASWKVGNFGVSGRTLLKKGDFPYWKEKAYQNALGFKPDLVIIMLGTNDTKPQNWKHEAEFVADYTELVKSFQQLESKPRVYVCRPCPVPEPGNYGINETNVKEEIKRLDALAAGMKLGLIDMHAALADKPQLLPDRVHPNTEGAGEMAKAAFMALDRKTRTRGGAGQMTVVAYSFFSGSLMRAGTSLIGMPALVRESQTLSRRSERELLVRLQFEFAAGVLFLIGGEIGFQQSFRDLERIQGDVSQRVQGDDRAGVGDGVGWDFRTVGSSMRSTSRGFLKAVETMKKTSSTKRMSIIGMTATWLRVVLRRWKRMAGQAFGVGFSQTWARSVSSDSSRAVSISMRRMK